MSFEATQFKGVSENENDYSVIGSGVLATDSGFVQTMFHSNYDFEGNHMNVSIYTKPVSYYLLNTLTGLKAVTPSLGFSSLGQTFDETTDSAAGFIASFDEEGDTTSVILFHSPYLEEFGEDFIAPQAIEASTNEDESFFVSSNIFKMDELTGTDCWVQRMTPDGETLWSYIYATEANPDNCKAMLKTENGGVLLGVWQFSVEEIFTYFIELDADGEELSVVTLETESRINDMVKNDQNQVIVASATPNGSPGLLGAVYKFNMQGVKIWEVLLGQDATGQEFTNIVHTSDNKYVAGGVHYEYVENPTDTSGVANKNGWLVKIDDDGIVEWDRKYHFINSPDDDHTLNDLKATSDGGYIFCGESTDYDTDQQFTEGPRQQGWLVKVDEYGCLVEGCQLSDNINVIENQEEIEYFKAGPIPAGQFLNIYQSHNTPSGAEYQFIDMNGKVLESFPALSKGTTMMLDVSKHAAGGYQLVLLKDGRVLQSQKIIVQGL